MKLSVLLFVLGLKLKVAGLFNRDFRKTLRGKDFVLVIRTADGGRARTFFFKNGRVRSRWGRDRRADTELVWCDPDTAVRVMLSKDELDGFSAIGSSRLRILGNFEHAMRFIDVAG